MYLHECTWVLCTCCHVYILYGAQVMQTSNNSFMIRSERWSISYLHFTFFMAGQPARWKQSDRIIYFYRANTRIEQTLASEELRKKHSHHKKNLDVSLSVSENEAQSSRYSMDLIVLHCSRIALVCSCKRKCHAFSLLLKNESACCWMYWKGNLQQGQLSSWC